MKTVAENIPGYTENFSETQLASLVARDAMIGVVKVNLEAKFFV